VVGVGVTGWDITLRDGTFAVDVSIAIANWFAVQRALINSATPVSTNVSGTLQQHVGNSWVPLVVWTDVDQPNNANANVLGNQETWVFRDTAFHKVKVIILEDSNVPPYKHVLRTQMNAGQQGFFDNYTVVPSAGTPTAYNWVLGRSGLYVGSFVSDVGTLNRRVRRRRGLA
jgi:hypothetical protein